MKLIDLLESSLDEVNDFEDELRRKFMKIGITLKLTQHFKDRITTENLPDEDGHVRGEITIQDLDRFFSSLIRKHSQLIELGVDFNDELKAGRFEGIIRSLKTGISVPFGLAFDKSRGRHVLTCKTAMKKGSKFFYPRPDDHLMVI